MMKKILLIGLAALCAAGCGKNRTAACASGEETAVTAGTLRRKAAEHLRSANKERAEAVRLLHALSEQGDRAALAALWELCEKDRQRERAEFIRRFHGYDSAVELEGTGTDGHLASYDIAMAAKDKLDQTIALLNDVRDWRVKWTCSQEERLALSNEVREIVGPKFEAIRASYREAEGGLSRFYCLDDMLAACKQWIKISLLATGDAAQWNRIKNAKGLFKNREIAFVNGVAHVPDVCDEREDGTGGSTNNEMRVTFDLDLLYRLGRCDYALVDYDYPGDPNGNWQQTYLLEFKDGKITSCRLVARGVTEIVAVLKGRNLRVYWTDVYGKTGHRTFVLGDLDATDRNQ